MQIQPTTSIHAPTACLVGEDNAADEADEREDENKNDRERVASSVVVGIRIDRDAFTGRKKSVWQSVLCSPRNKLLSAARATQWRDRRPPLPPPAKDEMDISIGPSAIKRLVRLGA